jgi:hypothetical protein
MTTKSFKIKAQNWRQMNIPLIIYIAHKNDREIIKNPEIGALWDGFNMVVKYDIYH